MWRTLISAILVSAVAMTGSTLIQKHRIEPLVSKELNEELLYLPNEHLIVNFTGGLSSVIADFMWIQTINYAAREFRSEERKFTWLEQMVRAVVRLDPYYEAAYSTGGIMLSALGQDDRSLVLLQEGLIRCPDSFEISLELVSIYLLNRREEPGAAAITLRYMPLLASNSSRPDYYLDWMDRIRMSENVEGEARRVWEDLLASATDEFVRELAQAQLIALEAEETAHEMNEAVAAFEAKFGDRPRTIIELVRSGLAGRPDMTGRIGTFYFDPNGKIRSTIIDVKIAERYRRSLQRALNGYRKRHGEFPAALAELSSPSKGDAEYHPVPGRYWDYDPVSGEVKDAPVTGDGR